MTMKKSLLFCTIISASAITGGAFAADCTSVSDSVTETRCKDLGYTMAASQCGGKNMVKCPLNTNWVWCGDGSAAPACNYTVTDTSKADASGGSCTKDGTTYYEKSCSGTKQSACDTSSYTFSTSCTSVNGTKYGSCTCAYTITSTTGDKSGKTCTKNGTTYYEKACSGTKESACDTSSNTFTTTCTTGSGVKYGTCTSTCNYTYTSTAMADASGGSCTKNGTTYYEKNCTGTAQTLCDTSTSSFTTICTSVSGKKYGLCTLIANACDPQEYIWDRCPVTNGQCEQCGQRFKFSCCNSGYLYYSESLQNCFATQGTDGRRSVTCKIGGIIGDGGDLMLPER